MAKDERPPVAAVAMVPVGDGEWQAVLLELPPGVVERYATERGRPDFLDFARSRAGDLLHGATRPG